jgi:DNA replication and repair protein RecF
MRLTRLHIHHVRNLNKIAFIPHPHFNIFLGENGSGKTSLLEAIYLLALGRSFRSRQVQSIIAHQKNELACYGEVFDQHDLKIPLGIEKNRQGEVKCKVGGEPCERLSLFAQQLPLQLITPETFKLLIEGPQERRRFLDWGVFHVEPSFSELCQRYQRLLKQRNAALKQSRGKSLQVWDKEFIAVGEKITALRQSYLVSLLPFADKATQDLLPLLPIHFEYEQGWSPTCSLEEALGDALGQDARLGYTSVGPHRAEINVTMEKFAAHQVLSRGQQKLLICALHLAQAQQLYASQGRKCLFLIDDLASELDNTNRQRLLARIATQNHQLFLTGVDAGGWQGVCEQYGGEMFHVEQGSVRSYEEISP